MATVTNTLKLPDGSTPVDAVVAIELVVAADGQTGAAWVDGTDVTVLAQAYPTVVRGQWTVDLTPNIDIDPAGTVYRVIETAGRHQVTYFIEVGPGGGAVHDLLTSGPSGLMFDSVTNAVAAHAADDTVHGATGAVVGTTNTQTLANKTLSAPLITSPVLSFSDPAAKAARLALDVQRRQMIDAGDYTTLQAAADAAAAAELPLWIGGDWTISSTVTFLCDVASNPTATITYTGSTGPAVKVGDGTQQRFNLRCHFPKFTTTKAWSAGSIGTKAAIQVDSVHVADVSFVEIINYSYGLHLAPTGPYGISYSEFRGGGVYETAIPLLLDCSDDLASWVNENRISIGTYGDPASSAPALTKVTGTRGIEMRTGVGGQPINNNVFVGGALEQVHFEYAVKTENALYNTWISPRMEVPAGFGEWHFGQTDPDEPSEYSFKNMVFMGYGIEHINLTESLNSFGNSIIGPGQQDLRGSVSTRGLMHVQNSNSGNAGAIRVYSPSSSPFVDPDDWNVQMAAFRVDYKNDGDSQPRFRISTTDGWMYWGPGGAGAVDTNLYRSGADTLKTDDSLQVGADLRHLGSALGFYGAAATAKPTVTGSKASGAAFASLLNALSTLGLITDGTSA